MSSLSPVLTPRSELPPTRSRNRQASRTRETDDINNDSGSGHVTSSHRDASLSPLPPSARHRGHEFVSVFQPQPHLPQHRNQRTSPPSSARDRASAASAGGGSTSSIAAAVPVPSRRLSGSSAAGLSDEDQLYNRIEEQIEMLDKKRIMLQQLLRSFHSSPYSSRLSRGLDSSRRDCAKLARKIHNLFKHVSVDRSSSVAAAVAAAENSKDRNSTDVTEAEAAAAAGAVATVNRFAPLFERYAEVTNELNEVCVESIQEEERRRDEAGAGSGSDSARGSGSRHGSISEGSVRHRVGRHVSSSSFDSDSQMSDDERRSSSDQHQHQQQQQQLLDDSLPALQVHGLEAYAAERKGHDYMHLTRMVSDIAHSFQMLHQLAHQQQRSIDHAQTNINTAHSSALEGERQLRKASRYKAFGLVMAGGLTGAAVGGPLGAMVGLKTGLSVGVGAGLLGVGGAMLGAAAGKQIQRARFVPLRHEEEEGQELLSREQREEQQREREASASARNNSAESSSVRSAKDGRDESCLSRKCL